MINRSMRIKLSILFACIFAAGVWVFYPSERDVQGYNDLMLKAQSSRVSNDKKDPFTATQYREGVVKDIYYHKGEYLSRIICDDSRLVFDQQSGGMVILEHMENLTCTIQKELFYQTRDGQEVVIDGEGKKRYRGKSGSVDTSTVLFPMQTIRVVNADKATYHYHTKVLKAERPVIKEYRANGHYLPDNFESALLLMEGVADDVNVSFDQDEMTFHANRLKGRVFSKGVRS